MKKKNSDFVFNFKYEGLFFFYLIFIYENLKKNIGINNHFEFVEIFLNWDNFNSVETQKFKKITSTQINEYNPFLGILEILKINKIFKSNINTGKKYNHLEDFFNNIKFDKKHPHLLE